MCELEAAGARVENANQARRLLALAEITTAATALRRRGSAGWVLQIVRDWVERFKARGPDGLLDGKAPDKLDVPANLNIIDHCCEAWNKLIDQPLRIITIDRRQWARGS